MRPRSLQVRRAAIGGFTVRSAFERRARVLASIRAVFDWVVVA